MVNCPDFHKVPWLFPDLGTIQEHYPTSLGTCYKQLLQEHPLEHVLENFRNNPRNILWDTPKNKLVCMLWNTIEYSRTSLGTCMGTLQVFPDQTSCNHGAPGQVWTWMHQDCSSLLGLDHEASAMICQTSYNLNSSPPWKILSQTAKTNLSHFTKVIYITEIFATREILMHLQSVDSE